MGWRQHGAGELDAVRFAGDMRALNLAREAADELLAQNDGDNPLLLRAKEQLKIKKQSIAQN